MTQSQDAIGLVKALGFVAWSDDRIAPEEREMLETVMNALGIPDDRRHELCQALKERAPTLEEIATALTDEVERRFAVAQAILMAQVDGDFHASERADIGRLARALDIDDEELSLIYAAVEVTNDVLGADEANSADHSGA